MNRRCSLTLISFRRPDLSGTAANITWRCICVSEKWDCLNMHKQEQNHLPFFSVRLPLVVENWWINENFKLNASLWIINLSQTTLIVMICATQNCQTKCPTLITFSAVLKQPLLITFLAKTFIYKRTNLYAILIQILKFYYLNSLTILTVILIWSA